MIFLNDNDATRATRCLQVLRSVFTNDVAFNQVVHKLAEDAQILENDPKYIRFMADMWNNYLTPNENTNVETAASEGWGQKCVNFFKGADPLETRKAYDFLELDCGASIDEINSSFRRLALIHHPDRGGGSEEDWQKLQVSMGVIKLSRGGI